LPSLCPKGEEKGGEGMKNKIFRGRPFSYPTASTLFLQALDEAIA